MFYSDDDYYVSHGVAKMKHEGEKKRNNTPPPVDKKRKADYTKERARKRDYENF